MHRLSQQKDDILTGDDLGVCEEEICECDVEEREGADDRRGGYNGHFGDSTKRFDKERVGDRVPEALNRAGIDGFAV